MMTLANKRFRLTANSNVRDFGTKTILTIDQNGDLLFGNYEGGKVLQGSFMAKMIDKFSFEKSFHHYNDRGALVSGKSLGKIEVLEDGRLRLTEKWNEDAYSGAAIYDELQEVAKNDIAQDDYYYQLVLNK